MAWMPNWMHSVLHVWIGMLMMPSLILTSWWKEFCVTNSYMIYIHFYYIQVAQKEQHSVKFFQWDIWLGCCTDIEIAVVCFKLTISSVGEKPCNSVVNKTVKLTRSSLIRSRGLFQNLPFDGKLWLSRDVKFDNTKNKLIIKGRLPKKS